MSDLERTLAFQLKAAGIKGWEQDARFHPERKWRGDFVWKGDAKLIVECEGGIFSGGRHVRGAAFEKDAEKYNAAALMGYSVLRFGPNAIKEGEALDVISTYLSYFGGKESA